MLTILDKDWQLEFKQYLPCLVLIQSVPELHVLSKPTCRSVLCLSDGHKQNKVIRAWLKSRHCAAKQVSFVASRL